MPTFKRPWTLRGGRRTQLGIKVNDYRIYMLRFVDDIVIKSENEKDLKNILGTLEKDLHMKITQKRPKFLYVLETIT